MPKKETEKKAEPKNEKKLDFAALIEGSIQQARKLKVVQGIEELEKVTSITQLTDLIVRKAWESGASDIHIDPLTEFFTMSSP
jgi:type II secretory ATPase GspE/PulE/Tfp pilus assembly ATPase PilB-like protein